MIITPENITIYDSKRREEIHEMLSPERDNFMRWVTIMHQYLDKNNIGHIIYLARQASPFESLLTGYFDSIQFDERPSQAHLSVSSSLPYTNFEERNQSNIEELQRILKTEGTKNVLILDHKVVSGGAMNKVRWLVHDISGSEDNQHFPSKYLFEDYREQMGGWPARVPWDVLTNIIDYDDKLSKNEFIGIRFNGSLETNINQNGSSTREVLNNPDPIRIVSNPSVQRDYFYLRQILYSWGWEAGSI